LLLFSSLIKGFLRGFLIPLKKYLLKSVKKIASIVLKIPITAVSPVAIAFLGI